MSLIDESKLQAAASGNPVHFSSDPIVIKCPQCKCQVITWTRQVASSLAWGLCAVLCMFMWVGILSNVLMTLSKLQLILIPGVGHSVLYLFVVLPSKKRNIIVRIVIYHSDRTKNTKKNPKRRFHLQRIPQLTRRATASDGYEAAEPLVVVSKAKWRAFNETLSLSFKTFSIFKRRNLLPSSMKMSGDSWIFWSVLRLINVFLAFQKLLIIVFIFKPWFYPSLFAVKTSRLWHTRYKHLVHFL